MLYASEWKLRCRLRPAERYPPRAANVMTGLRGAKVKALACTRTHGMIVPTFQSELHAALSGQQAAA